MSVDPTSRVAAGPGLPGEPNHGPGLTSRALYRTVLLAAFLVAAGLLLDQLATLLVAVLITVIVAIPASALAAALERFRVPRAIGALLGIAALVGLFGGVLALVIPPVVEQGRDFVDDLPRIVDAAVERVAHVTGAEPARVGDELQSVLKRYTNDPTVLLGPVASASMTVLSVGAGVIVVLITAYYMAVRPEPLVRGALRLFPPERRAHAEEVMRRLRRAWIGWLQGVVVDMVVTGVLLYVGLSLAGVEFALLFAAFSAVVVVVPYFGSFVGGIPPVLFALTDSPGNALLVLGIYLLVQQVEGNVIVPLVMADRVRLHPAVVAVGVLVVGALFGLIGLFVSVPIISTAVILVEELWVKPRERSSGVSLDLPFEPDLEAPAHRPDLGAGEPRDARVGGREWAQAPGAAEGPRRRDGRGEPQLGPAPLPRIARPTGLRSRARDHAGHDVHAGVPRRTLRAGRDGAAHGAEGLLALFVPVLAGSRSDEVRTRLGRRMPFLLAATPFAAGALVLMPLLGSLFALVVLLLIFYASCFTYYSPYYALYPDLVPAWARARSQGFQTTLRELGLGGALVAGGVLVGLWKPLPFLVGAVVLTGVTLTFAWRVEEPESPDDHRRTHREEGTLARLRRLVVENRGLRWLAAAIALWEFTLAALKTFVVLFFTVGLGRSTGFASAVLAVVAAGVLGAAVVSGRLADRFGHARLVGASLWVYGLGVAVPAFWHEPPTIVLVLIVAFAAGVVMTLSFSMMMGVMPSEAHGAASGLYGFVRGVGVLLGPVVAGASIQLLEPAFSSTKGYAALFLVAAAGILASVPIMRVVAREEGETASRL